MICLGTHSTTYSVITCLCFYCRTTYSLIIQSLYKLSYSYLLLNGPSVFPSVWVVLLMAFEICLNKLVYQTKNKANSLLVITCVGFCFINGFSWQQCHFWINQNNWQTSREQILHVNTSRLEDCFLIYSKSSWTSQMFERKIWGRFGELDAGVRWLLSFRFFFR